MKIKLSFIIVLLMCRVCTAQNLVPNGDFEGYVCCPTFISQLSCALDWVSPTTILYGTPDYFNQCANPSVAGVPDNYFGSQPAYGGNGYACIIVRGIGAPEYREYIEVPLLSPLIAGNCYHFEMQINSFDSARYSTDAIGVYFSDTLISGITNFNPLPFTPQITNTPGNFPDTINWISVSGNYVATGGESYLVIGNFNYVFNMNTIVVDPLGYFGAGVYVDDVCLSPCTSPCFTGINEQNNIIQANIYPNPTHSSFTITSPATITQLKITNTIGQLIYQTKPNDKTAEVKINDKGVYFVSITTGSGVVTKKVVVE